MTTKLLKLVAEQDQAEMAARHNGERRAYETRWVIERMKANLPPEHVTLARKLRDIAARAAGIRLASVERVDQGNASEAGLLSRLDAGRILVGYEGAVRSRLDQGGVLCLRSIVEEHTMAETLKACGYRARSWQSVRQLVQLTMMAAADYADECTAQRERWRAL